MKKRPSFNNIEIPSGTQPSTQAIRTQLKKTPYKEHSPALYLTSGYWFDDAEDMRKCFADETEGYAYSRYSNPNTDEFAAKLATLEKVEAGISVASGMGAIFCALMSVLNKGDHIIVSRSLFGSTFQLMLNQLPRWGIEISFVDTTDIESWQKSVLPNSKMVFLETPTNPGLEIVDMQLVGNFCRHNNLLMVVDNCFATPCLQTPSSFGADLIIHSATKFIDGQGRVMGGAVLGSQELIEKNYAFLRQTGACLSPFNAWLLSRSVDTLPLRMKAHSENAFELANWLEKQTGIKKVLYPGLPSHPQHDLAMKQMSSGGGIVTFELPGGIEDGARFLNSITLLTISANLGDTRTIVSHPASTTHARLSQEQRKSMSISDCLIRISVGLEDVKDIIEALDRALHTYAK